MTEAWFGGFSLIRDMSMRIFTEKADLLAVCIILYPIFSFLASLRVFQRIKPNTTPAP